MKKMLFAAAIAVMVCSCNADDELEQNPAPTNASGAVAGFELTKPNDIVMEGSALDLINTSQNAKSYLWDFGDGTTSIEARPYYVPKCGSHTVKLTITDANGKQTSVEKVVDVFCTVPLHRANPMMYSRN